MKRSEMIKKMAELFQEREYYQQYRGYSHEGLAEEFLRVVEELGMLPPARILTVRHGLEPDSVQHETIVTTWDGEDEEK